LCHSYGQSSNSRLAGYEDVNDAERLCIDFAMRYVVGGRASQPEKQAASSSEVGRFETEIPSIKANALLDREIELLLTHPVGRPSQKPKVFCHSFRYQAKSWQRERRVVTKVEWHAGELFPRVGLMVTNLTQHAKYVTFQLAEVAVPRRLFAAILDRIAPLAMPPPGVATPCV